MFLFHLPYTKFITRNSDYHMNAHNHEAPTLLVLEVLGKGMIGLEGIRACSVGDSVVQA